MRRKVENVRTESDCEGVKEAGGYDFLTIELSPMSSSLRAVRWLIADGRIVR